MAYVQFTSVEALKDKSVLQSNVDEKILGIAIREFQDLELRNSILGRTEYDRLAAAIAASLTGGDPLSADDLELMDYITPVMIYGALMYSIAPLKIKFSNKGTQELTDDHAKAIDSAAARENYSFKLEGYKRILKDYRDEKNKSNVQESEIGPACTGNKRADTTFGFSGTYIPDDTKNRRPWGGYGSNSELNESM